MIPDFMPYLQQLLAAIINGAGSAIGSWLVLRHLLNKKKRGPKKRAR